jgi:hypothetical protein
VNVRAEWSPAHRHPWRPPPLLYNYSGGYSWYTYRPGYRLQHDIAGELGTGAWGHIVGTYDQNGGANNQRLWLNGVVKAEATVSGALQAGSEGIGEEIRGVSDPFDGVIDEVRISTVVHPDAWLRVALRNLTTPTSFMSSGVQETEGGGGGPAPRRPIVIAVAT